MSGSVRIPPHRLPLLGPYNGFTGLERARGAQLTRWAVLAGLIERPASCSICGALSGRLQHHSENYYDPLHPYPVCMSCHMKLHRRFRVPGPWASLIERHAWAGSWFAELSMAPIDIAAMVRGRHGEAITDVLATVKRQLPPHIEPPTGRLVSLATL